MTRQCCRQALLLLLILGLLGGCASRPAVGPEATNDSMVIWWSPSSATASETENANDYTRVQVPNG